MAGVRIFVKKLDINPTILQQKLYKIAHDETTLRGVNEIIAETAEKYIPYKTGNLRRSVHIGPKTIAWTAPYARYQYYGEIYGPNYPIVKKDSAGQTWKVVGWYSPPKKHKTGRELGVPRFWINGDLGFLGMPRHWFVHKFGYTTPGTKHHWLDVMLSKDKRTLQVRITNYLKRRARELESSK